jgi:ABC-type nitrate/sulfonate/bicarbonate transport system permease component
MSAETEAVAQPAAGFRPDPRVATVLLPFGLLLLWQLAASSTGSADAFSPLGIIRVGWGLLLDGTLASAIVVSWKTVGQGFLVAVLIAVPMGLLAGYWSGFGDWFRPIINVLRPIAPFAWIPMAILWFGATSGASVMISAYAAFFPIVTNTESGVGRVRTSLVTAAQTLGASRSRIFWRVVIPSALPLTFVGLRLGLGLAWASVIAAELAIGKSMLAPPGIGYLMYLNFAIEADLNAIGAMMVSVAVSALAVDWVMWRLQVWLIHWPVES